MPCGKPILSSVSRIGTLRPSATHKSPDSFRPGPDEERPVGRTFIQPSQTIRQLGIRLKLNPLKEVIRGKRLIVVDDSIVRETLNAR